MPTEFCGCTEINIITYAGQPARLNHWTAHTLCSITGSFAISISPKVLRRDSDRCGSHERSNLGIGLCSVQGQKIKFHVWHCLGSFPSSHTECTHTQRAKADWACQVWAPNSWSRTPQLAGADSNKRHSPGSRLTRRVLGITTLQPFFRRTWQTSRLLRPSPKWQILGLLWKRMAYWAEPCASACFQAISDDACWVRPQNKTYFYPNKNNSMEVIRPVSSYVISWRNLGHNYSNGLREAIGLAEITLPVSGRVPALTFRSHSLFSVLVFYFKSITSSLKDRHPNHDFATLYSQLKQCSAPAVGHKMAWGRRTGGGIGSGRGANDDLSDQEASEQCLP